LYWKNNWLYAEKQALTYFDPDSYVRLFLLPGEGKELNSCIGHCLRLHFNEMGIHCNITPFNSVPEGTKVEILAKGLFRKEFALYRINNERYFVACYEVSRKDGLRLTNPLYRTMFTDDCIFHLGINYVMKPVKLQQFTTNCEVSFTSPLREYVMEGMNCILSSY